MLVLSRCRNDKIVFPTLGISVEVLRVGRNKVQLGIEAPADILVYRREIADRTTREDFSNGHSKSAR